MNRTFFMQTKRIGFSKWNVNDTALAQQLWGSPEVTKYICATGVFTKEQIQKRLELEIENNEKYSIQYWPIFALETGELIGCCGLRPYAENTYEIGFHLRPQFWGKGYAMEAANAAIEYAFTTLQAEKIFAGHNPKNVGSQKVLAKLGFEYLRDEFYEPTGLYHPSYEKTRFTTLKKNLENKGYVVNVFDTKEAAATHINKQIHEKTVGIGGSVTVRQMNLFEMLSEHNTVYWHDEKPENLTVKETRTIASRADIYISSVNGIAETGEIVNIDNTGNRVAAISYGPEKVYLLVGKNKVEADLDKAIYRARNVAGPLNAQRLKRKTPCAAKADKCYDCNSPERICRNLSVLWTKPTGAEYEIVLINEALGY